jgi:DUF4097 and DUF4098 domain-containing protein YvlB
VRGLPLLALLLLAGCLQPPVSVSVDDAGPSDPSDGSPPAGANAGSPATHGTPQRTESPVTVEREGNRYVARRNVTVTNDYGGATAASLTLHTRNGGVAVQPWDDGGYRLHARVEARADTEQAARETLAAIEVATVDDLGPVLTLRMEARFREPAATSLPVRLGDQLSWGATLSAWLPPEPILALEARTTNGAVAVRGMHGPEAEAHATNGAIALDGAWQLAQLVTTNGPIVVSGTAADVQATTTNGAVTGTVEVPRGGRHRLESTNGAITWSLATRDGQVYAVDATTQNGRVTVDLPGLKGSGSSFHGQTPGYDEAEHQVALELETTNGPIRVAAR